MLNPDMALPGFAVQKMKKRDIRYPSRRVAEEIQDGGGYGRML